MTACDHNHDSLTQNSRRLLWALAVIVVFMVVEAVGGILSGSLALIADAGHMLTDAFALSLAASASFLARRPADSKLHFGYRRAQVLAAFVNGLLMVVLLFWIVFEAVTRFSSPIAINVQLMFSVALIGLFANFAALAILHSNDSHDLNTRGALLHVIGDLFGSVAAIIAACVIFFTGWMAIDPILSILVAGLIGVSAFRLLREAGYILLEGAPENIDVDLLARDLQLASDEITGIHNVQISQITPDQLRLTMHVSVASAGATTAALSEAKAFLAQKYDIMHSTIQVEIGDQCIDKTDQPVMHEDVSMHSLRSTVVSPDLAIQE